MINYIINENELKPNYMYYYSQLALILIINNILILFCYIYSHLM